MQIQLPKHLTEIGQNQYTERKSKNLKVHAVNTMFYFYHETSQYQIRNILLSLFLKTVQYFIILLHKHSEVITKSKYREKLFDLI